MRRFVGLFAIILLLVSALFAPALGAENPNRGLAPVVQAQGKAIPNHYIVVVKEGADGRAVAAVAGV